MRSILALILLACGSALLMSDTGAAQDKKNEKTVAEKKEVVLKGTITCGKCDLGVDKACATVIVVKGEKDKKDVVYYFDKASHTKFHDGVCTEAKKGTVEATIVDDGKKKIITAKKVTFDK